jgi:hypothetical protein
MFHTEQQTWSCTELTTALLAPNDTKHTDLFATTGVQGNDTWTISKGPRSGGYANSLLYDI